MQTFLPYADFEQSAKSLDYKRLGKQRVETLQILKALTQGGGLHGGWARHPASRAWVGYELALLAYQEAVCDVWDGLGFKDTCRLKTRAFFTEEQLDKLAAGDYEMPPWFGDEDYHRRHRSNLLRKDPVFYGEVFTDVPDDLPYIWPGASLEDAKVLQGV
jgi:hypothetical protein